MLRKRMLATASASRVRTSVGRISAAITCLALIATATAFGANGASVDRSFGQGGSVFTATGAAGSNWSAFGLAEDAGGRLVAAGGANDSFVIARYEEDGTLDPTFGAGDGLAYLADWRDEIGQTEAAAMDAAVQPDGKVVAVGYWLRRDVPPFMGVGEVCWAIARLLPDGSPDPAFGGGDGRVLQCSAGTVALAVAVKRDGKLLVAGAANRNRRGTLGRIARFNPDGTLDRGFGGRRSGLFGISPPPGEHSAVHDLELLPSGKILASGYFRFNFMVARLLPNGTLDRSFARAAKRPGRLITDVDGRCGQTGCAIGWGMDRDRTGRILVSGYVQQPNPREHIALVRYRPGGKLDTTFGRRGVVRTKIGGYASARHLAVQRNGRIVVGGESGSVQSPRFTLVRYRPSGRLDPTFFGDGVFARASDSDSSARDLLIDEAQRITATGGLVRDGQKGFFLTRITG
jgi:uncharacterized delta-60 repeat protein